MEQNDFLLHLEKAIQVSYDSRKPWFFADAVRRNLERSEHIEKFNFIWAAACDFRNWNSPSLVDGERKTITLLTEKYQLTDVIAQRIARAAGYEWK